MLSSHVYVHVGACLFYYTVLWWIVQWCRSNLWVAFQGERSFLQKTQLQLESLPTVFHDQGERTFYCTLWVNKKSKTIWFHTSESRRFMPPSQFIHLQLLHHRNDQNYYISINGVTAYFLVRPFSCFRNTSKYSCICLLVQTRSKWRHIAIRTH